MTEDDISCSYSCNEECDPIWIDDLDNDNVSVDDKNEWTNVNSPITTISYDQAQHDAWESAKIEVECVRKNVLNRLRLQKYEDFKIELLIDHVVEKLWIVIDENLNDGVIYSIDNPLTKVSFKKIIGTFFVACSFGISAKSLFSDEMISQDGLCSHEQYIMFWKSVSKNDSGDYDNSKTFLWQLVSEEINSLCRDLFLKSWMPNLQKHVTIDDDKNHFNGGNGYFDTSGLKPAQFVRDNRRGFVFHTMVFTASGIPIGLEAELVSDASSSDAASRLITQQLAPAYKYSPGNVPNLSNLVIYADRLYWTKWFLEELILPSGADVGPSTHKRQHGFPFTYDQKLTKNDTRELIPKLGGKFVKIKEKHYGSHKVSAVAYRDGRGKVVLGMASGNCQVTNKHWDFHFANPRDRYKLLDPRSGWHTNPATWIRTINGTKELSEDFIHLLSTTTHVKAMTTEGSKDHAWFIARGFSFTSSTVDKIIHAANDFFKNEGKTFTDDSALVESLNVILKYIRKPLITIVSQQSEEVIGATVVIEPDVYVGGVNITNEIRLLNQNDKEVTESFVKRIGHQATFSSECVESLLSNIGGKPVKARNSNCATVLKWINLDPIEKRKYHFLSKPELVDECLSRLKGVKKDYKQSKENLVALLATSDINANSTDATSDTHRGSLNDILTTQILSSSFMKPVSGQNRKSTRIGLDSEKKLLKRLIMESKGADVLCPSEQYSKQIMHVSEIYRPGMVKMVGKDYVKSSIDALGVMYQGIEGSDPELIGVEVKTRTTESTRHPEIELRKVLQRGHKFVMIPSNLVKTYIPNNHESIQILHHAFVYNLKKVLLLIGDGKGYLLRGVWVIFDDDFKSAYNNFLTRCYEYCLSWAYDRSCTNTESESQFLDSLQDLFPKHLDLESFRDYFYLWRCACHNEDRLPIPRTIYIVPLHFAIWNKFKGGSDTITKLFWNCKHYIPSNTPAANALSHLLRFIAVMLCRCESFMCCNEDLSSYETLLSWRTSNNTRQGSFELFLRRIYLSYFRQNNTKSNNVQQNEQRVPIIVSPEPIQGNSSENTLTLNTWGASQTFKTPLRNVSGKYERNAVAAEVSDRRRMCTGKIVKRVSVDENGKIKKDGPGSRGRCVQCKKQSHYYCMKCKVWLCGPGDGGIPDHIHYVLQKEGPSIHFKSSCWNMWHDIGLQSDACQETL